MKKTLNAKRMTYQTFIQCKSIALNFPVQIFLLDSKENKLTIIYIVMYQAFTQSLFYKLSIC